MSHHRQPPSERLKTIGADPQLVREVQKLEQISVAGVSYVAANGRGLKGWPIERWLLVAGIVANSLAYTFGAGGTWHAMREDVSKLKDTHVGFDRRLTSDERQIDENRNAITRVDTALSAHLEEQGRQPGTYRFGKGESLIARPVQ